MSKILVVLIFVSRNIDRIIYEVNFYKATFNQNMFFFTDKKHFRIDNKLITAPTNDRILDGITRKSVIQIAKDINIDIEVRPFSVDELVSSANNKSLKEVFGAGTAVVILPISGFGYKNIDYNINLPENSYAKRIKKMITDIQYNVSKDPYGWRVGI